MIIDYEFDVMGDNVVQLVSCSDIKVNNDAYNNLKTLFPNLPLRRRRMTFWATQRRHCREILYFFFL